MPTNDPQPKRMWIVALVAGCAAVMITAPLWLASFSEPSPKPEPDASSSTAPANETTSSGECPKIEGEYRPALDRASGAAGSTVVASGPMPVHAEGGRYVGPRSRKVEVWWNLAPRHWTSAVSFREPSPEPMPDRNGEAILLGVTETLGHCYFALQFEVPPVQPGNYRIVALYYGRKSAAMFRPMTFGVTTE